MISGCVHRPGKCSIRDLLKLRILPSVLPFSLTVGEGLACEQDTWAMDLPTSPYNIPGVGCGAFPVGWWQGFVGWWSACLGGSPKGVVVGLSPTKWLIKKNPLAGQLRGLGVDRWLLHLPTP